MAATTFNPDRRVIVGQFLGGSTGDAVAAMMATRSSIEAATQVRVYVRLHPEGGYHCRALSRSGSRSRSLSVSHTHAQGCLLGCIHQPIASPTRVCTTLLDEARGEMTELIDPTPTVTAAESSALVQLLRSKASGVAGIALMGSVPAGTLHVFDDTIGCPALRYVSTSA